MDGRSFNLVLSVRYGGVKQRIAKLSGGVADIKARKSERRTSWFSGCGYLGCLSCEWWVY